MANPPVHGARTVTDQQSGREKQVRRRPIWFWPVVALAILVLVPVAIAITGMLALRSETGTAWVLDQIPGLQVEQGQGSLLGQWQARDLRWQGYGVSVKVGAPRIEWSPSCLLSKQLCIDGLQAQTLDVAVQPSSSETALEPLLDLPGIDIPLALAIRNLELGTFRFNGSRIWDRMELAASGSGASWQLERVRYQFDDYRAEASGRLETRGDWPLDLTITGQLPPPAGEHWLVDLGLAGSVRDLRLSGTSKGYLDGQFQGRVSPLERTLPARLRATLDSFRAYTGLPDTLVVHNAVVEAEGSLASGFLTRISATMKGTEGPVTVSGKGRIATDAARDLELLLSTGAADPDGYLKLTGVVNWQGGLSADGQVSMTSFPWYSLIPDLSAPEVELTDLDATLGWHDGQYHALVQARANGPLGEATLSSELAGDLQQASLTGLKLETGAGSLAGSGEVDYSGPLSWQAALELENFNPGYWFPLLEASLSGALETSGQLRADTIPDIRARWDLAGNWRSHGLLARGRMETRSGGWELSGLEVEVGSNRLSGSGFWGDTLAGNLQLLLPAPEQLMAGLGGEASAELTLSGTPAQPQGKARVRSENLSWQDSVALEMLNIDGLLHEGMRLESRVQASGVDIAGQRLDSATLNLDGTRNAHGLTLTANNSEVNLRIVLEGAFDETWKSWQGALDQGLIGLPGQSQQWQLQSPLALAYRVDGELSAGAHCWAWQDSSVCAGDQVLLPDLNIGYRISNFPTSALAPLMPDNLRWQARIDGDVDVAMTANGPEGRVQLDAGEGVFQILQDGEWQSLEHHTFNTVLNLKPEQADLDIRLAGPALGTLSVQAGVDPRSPERTVAGNFSLEGLDLALAGIFSGLEEASGEIHGQGRFSGPLMKPGIYGELALTNGQLMDPALPVAMEKLTLSLDMRGYEADIRGRIQASERSEAIVTGLLNWASAAPEGSVTVTGERLPFSLEPGVHLELAPDITVAFSQGDLSVAGQVAVPRGSIEIKGLPEQAVSVSADEVIVGEEKPEPVIRSLNMDVRVLVGAEQVTFSAFGLTGDLEGTLRIGNDMDTRGTLQLVNGNYDAYGQELELRRARLIFVGNLAQPYLDIEAVRTVDSVVAGLRLTGSVQAPETEVFSEPDMSQTDALSYLILGRASQSRSDEGQMSRAALSLGLTQANKVTGRLGEELGIRQLTLEAEGSGDDTSVVASGYLTDELSIRYGVGVFEQATKVALRYDLGKYFYLEAASGLAASLDIFYTRDF